MWWVQWQGVGNVCGMKSYHWGAKGQPCRDLGKENFDVSFKQSIKASYDFAIKWGRGKDFLKHSKTRTLRILYFISVLISAELFFTLTAPLPPEKQKHHREERVTIQALVNRVSLSGLNDETRACFPAAISWATLSQTWTLLWMDQAKASTGRQWGVNMRFLMNNQTSLE